VLFGIEKLIVYLKMFVMSWNNLLVLNIVKNVMYGIESLIVLSLNDCGVMDQFTCADYRQ
jgi:hypothetical protein